MNRLKKKPTVIITLGDPAGIGPEICISCLMDSKIYETTAPVLIGDEEILRRAMRLKDCDFKINIISHPEQGNFKPGTIDLIQTDHGADDDFSYGTINRNAAKMAQSFILEAIDLGQQGLADVVTTSPINKESFVKAGFEQADHTAILKHYYPERKTTSMFHCRELKVFHYTRHISLKDAIAALDADKITDALEQIHYTLQSVGIKEPVIAVAALNPHASDNGMFGDEEERILIPAIENAGKAGIKVVGPVPADSVFYLQRQGHFHGILSLFHDQGHIACKTCDFERSVSLTFGLPFVRSTVDHGTAYDIAGKGIASDQNLKEAILIGAEYWYKMNAVQEI